MDEIEAGQASFPFTADGDEVARPLAVPVFYGLKLEQPIEDVKVQGPPNLEIKLYDSDEPLEELNPGMLL